MQDTLCLFLSKVELGELGIIYAFECMIKEVETGLFVTLHMKESSSNQLANEMILVLLIEPDVEATIMLAEDAANLGQHAIQQ